LPPILPRTWPSASGSRGWLDFGLAKEAAEVFRDVIQDNDRDADAYTGLAEAQFAAKVAYQKSVHRMSLSVRSWSTAKRFSSSTLAPRGWNTRNDISVSGRFWLQRSTGRRDARSTSVFQRQPRRHRRSSRSAKSLDRMLKWPNRICRSLRCSGRRYGCLWRKTVACRSVEQNQGPAFVA
jgi:hypothetical protein